MYTFQLHICACRSGLSSQRSWVTSLQSVWQRAVGCSLQSCPVLTWPDICHLRQVSRQYDDDDADLAITLLSPSCISDRLLVPHASDTTTTECWLPQSLNQTRPTTTTINYLVRAPHVSLLSLLLRRQHERWLSWNDAMTVSSINSGS